MNDASKKPVFAVEKVMLGEDKEKKTDLQAGKLSFCKRGKGFFCDVVMENVFE